MRKLLRVISMLLLLAAMAPGCRRPDVSDGSVPELNVFIDIPQPVLTRADEGNVANESDAEYQIHTLQIWVFLSQACGNFPAGYCVGYLKPAPHYFKTGGSSYAIPIDAAIAEAHPDVDVYVIANAEAAGCGSIGGATTRAQLDALTMSGTTFGVYGGTAAVSEVPDAGLPFTGVGKGLRIKRTYPSLSVDAVRLTRAVSKVRFVFAQLVDDEGPMTTCAVRGVQIYGGGIAAAEYLFNDTANPYKILASQYESSSMNFFIPSTFSIAPNTDPEAYAFKGQGAQEYANLIASGLETGALTSLGRAYLRETDRKLSGTISYRLNGVDGSVTFVMKDTGDFARNHDWIVYLYFTRDAIKFTVSWTPWEEGHDYYITDIT